MFCDSCQVSPAFLQESNVPLVLSTCLNPTGASWVIGNLTATHVNELGGFFQTRLSSLSYKAFDKCLFSAPVLVNNT